MSEKPQPVAWISEASETTLRELDVLGAATHHFIAQNRPSKATATVPLYSEASLSLARNEALEEAAKVMDDEADKYHAAAIETLSVAEKVRLISTEGLLRRYAAAIRARKT